jgi:hypothetical protein
MTWLAMGSGATGQTFEEAAAPSSSGPGLSYPAFEAAYGAPGHFGMAYGTPSFGMPATFTVFSSSYGAGYGYGYAPAAFLPGPYGLGLWRPGLVAPGTLYGVAYYRTFPVPYQPVPSPPPPPVGAYAPALGPTLSGYPW